MNKKTKRFLFYPLYACVLAVIGLSSNINTAQLAGLIAAPILYTLFEALDLTNDTKVKIAQAIVYLGSTIALLFYFNWTMILAGLVGGWVLFGMGVSVCLHKWASHRTFIPKNRFYKWIILWFGTLCTLGSTISWAASHREHHKHTDKTGDPHSPAGNWWHKLKVYFYYFPTYLISPLLIKDLTVDPDHKWFHRNYYKIIYGYALVLWLINPYYIVYFYLLPALYVFICISWVTVIAHLPGNSNWFFRKYTYRIYPSKDYTYNSQVWQFVLMGEGYHNTHHSCPWLWNNAVLPGEFDLSAKFIKLLGIPNTVPPTPIKSVRRGSAMFDEIAQVRKEIEGR